MTWGAEAWAGVGGGDGPDTTPPTIDNFAPDEDVAIGRTDPVAFDVKDGSGEFAATVVLARFLEEGVAECAWNALGFESRYAAGSSRVPIANGHRYTVRRQGGWLSTPLQLVILAIDAAGNVTRREIGYG
jgi:hypothetical protein